MSRYSNLRDPGPEGMIINLPASLPDASVVHLLEVLHAITAAIENHYAEPLCRYYCDPPDERQYPLWDDDPIDEDDLPF